MDSVTTNLSGSPANNQVKKICTRFVDGNCTFGKKCKYLHEVQKSTGPGKSRNTASNKGVKAVKETDPELIALMEEARIAEESVRIAKAKSEESVRIAKAKSEALERIAKAKSELNAASASSNVPQQQVAVVARKEKPAFRTVFNNELDCAEFCAKKANELENIIKLSVLPTPTTIEGLAAFHAECDNNGYTAVVKGEPRVLGVKQGIQFAVFKSNPSEFRNHYNSIDPITKKLYIPREAAAFFSG